MTTLDKAIIANNSVILGNLFKDLKLQNGTNNKKAFVLDYCKDETNRLILAEFISQVFSKENFYQTKIDKTPNKPSIFEAPITVDLSWYNATKKFFEGERRGDKGRENLNTVYNRCMTPEDQELLEYIVLGEVKCGIGAATWNKLLDEDVVYIPRYQRCSKLSDGNHKNWDSIIVQTKEDAQFVNIVCTQNSIEMFTRNWNLITCAQIMSPLNIIRDAFNTAVDKMFIARKAQRQEGVLMGEIYVTDPDGNRYGREKSNGMITAIIQTGENLPEGCGFDVTIWDFVDIDSHQAKKSVEPYTTRFTLSTKLVHFINDELKGSGVNFKIGMVKSQPVSDMAEVGKIFHQIVNSKGEGVVIKNPDGIWEHNDNGHKDIVKVKLPMNVKLRVESFNEAEPTSRHANTFASINMRSECGRIVTAMSGMKDADRLRFNNDREAYIGQIFEVKCNGIQYNPEEPHSLYYANYLCERKDVDSAQDFDDIVKVQQSAVDAISMI